MKRIIATLLAFVFIFGLVSCKNKRTEDKSTGTDSQTVKEESKTEADDPIVVTDETEAPVPQVPASGYCAVGEVDAEGKKAAVLFGNGLVKTMDFAGDAPASGTVMYFETENGKIAFAAANLGEEYKMWRAFSDPNGDLMYSTDGKTEWRYYFDENAVGFIKFSDTSWIAMSGKVMLNIGEGVFEYPNTGWPSNLTALDADGNTTIDVIFADATVKYNNGEVTDVTLLFSGSASGLETGDRNVVIEK